MRRQSRRKSNGLVLITVVRCNGSARRWSKCNKQVVTDLWPTSCRSGREWRRAAGDNQLDLFRDNTEDNCGGNWINIAGEMHSSRKLVSWAWQIALVALECSHRLIHHFDNSESIEPGEFSCKTISNKEWRPRIKQLTIELYELSHDLLLHEAI